MLCAFTMRGKSVIALFLVAMLLVPVQAGDVNAQQTQEEDPKQPNSNKQARLQIAAEHD